MTVTRREDLRPWSDLPGEDQILAVVGAPTFARGMAYAKSGRVSWLTSDPDRRVLFAAVEGTDSRPYQTIVQVGDARGDRLSEGRCTCPVAVDCKHVAAVLLAARDDLTPLSRTARSWERQLADVVEEETESEQVPIGLQLEPVVEPGWRGAPDRVRVRLRPVVPGKKSPWVRSGIGWRDLSFRWGAYGRVDAHREALHALHQAHQPSAYTYSDPAVFLDEFGPALWPLLRAVADAGVPFVHSRAAAGAVVLADGPATVSLELSRDDDGLLAVPVVDVPGFELPETDDDGRPGGVMLVGRPSHGVVLDLVGAAALGPSSAGRSTWRARAEVAGPGADARVGRSGHQGTNGPRRPGAASGRSDVGLVLAPLERPLTARATSLVAAGELDVPAEDVDRFLAEYYPTLRQLVTVRSSDGSVELPTIVPPRLGLTLTYEPDHHLTLEWAFCYDVAGTARRVPLDATRGPGRDSTTEQRLLRELDLPAALQDGPGRSGPAPTLQLRGLDAAVFVEETLPGLREQGVVVEEVGTPVEYRRSDSAPVIKVSATDAEEGDWFDLGVLVEIDGERIPFESLFVALARGDSHLVLLSGTYFGLDRPELDQLRHLIEEASHLQDRPANSLRLTSYQAGLWEELAALGVVEEESARWTGSVRRLLAGEGADPPAAPAGLTATLRPYQLEGFRWLSYLWEAGLGGILADDMGLGKTVQTLATLLRAKATGTLTAPALVVAPTSVVAGWAEEARRFAPDLEVVAVGETQKKSGRALADDVAGADLVVTSYALFRIDEAAYRELTWSGLILDEAQFVKNHQAKTYQVARRLRAPFKLAITGTPLENSLMDLWSLLSIVAPGMYPDPKVFTELYRKPIERGTRPGQLETLRRRIRPFIRRRTKEQVATDLPPKQEQVLHVQLNPRHRKIYDTHLQRERRKILSLLDDVEKNRFTILRSLTLLRQLSLDAALVDEKYAGVRSSKVDVLFEQLEEVVAGGHRALVFSQFTGFLATVRDRLDADGTDYCYLDGRTRNRARRIEEFKTGDAPVFLISLKAGGFGLNLTEADYCFILDPWWNPAAEAQAVDRTHRIGQDKTVMVYRMVAEETIEEKVVELQQRKRDLFDKVVDDGGSLAAPLSAADIKELLAP
ncbi:DEAD/DEAH box helicase [Georgenia subflava]|uniref:DEAD/DEAH box helicase n=1 Tax=Georgenia subflava TaxID=1622177 RepID=UPI001264E9E8|nr:SNF2-related protein [Georgenia subflava]